MQILVIDFIPYVTISECGIGRGSELLLLNLIGLALYNFRSQAKICLFLNEYFNTDGSHLIGHIALNMLV